MPVPEISVLLPFRNAADSLKPAVESIQRQNSVKWELILVDNNSTDAGSLPARQLASDDHRIRICKEPRAGIAHALNTGLTHCRGKYIARMDADDIMLPGRLQAQSDFLDKNPSIGLVAGLVEFRGPQPAAGYSAYVDQINSWISEEQLRMHRFVESPFAHPSVMFRKELPGKYGNYTQEELPEDYELWLRWMNAGVRMAKLEMFVLQWNDRPDRLSRIHPSYSAEAFDLVRYRYLSDWLKQQASSLPPVYVWGAGKLARRKMKLLEELSGVSPAGLIDIKPALSATLPYLFYKDIPGPGEIFIISMVSNRGKYAEIRDFLGERGYHPEKDFILAG